MGLSILSPIVSSSYAAAATRATNSIRFEGNQYLSSAQTYFRQGADSDNTSLSLLLNDEYQYRRHFFGKALVKDSWVASENWNYLDVHELYAAYRDKKETLTIGRKLDDWATWESEWNQGVFQARYLENGMRPEFAGLTGVFLSSARAHRDLSWSVGLLPIFIPDFGAHFYLSNHQFVSRNPWFSPPAANFTYNGATGNIRYSLEKPTAQEVLPHAGLVAKTEYRSGKYFARLSGAYKPMPAFLLGFPYARLTLGDDGDYFPIDVQARILYHRVFNLDQQYKWRQWTFSFSTAFEGPVEIKPREADATVQEATPAWILSGFADRPLELAGRHAASIRFGFFKVNGGDAPDSGPYKQRNSLFQRRYQFQEAYSLGLHKEFRHFTKNPLVTNFKVIYDRLQRGGMLSMDTALTLARNWSVNLELDFIGLIGGSGQVQDGFLSTYRANDRLGVGMSYVF
jgi:hypothetical protein